MTFLIFTCTNARRFPGVRCVASRILKTLLSKRMTIPLRISLAFMAWFLPFAAPYRRARCVRSVPRELDGELEVRAGPLAVHDRAAAEHRVAHRDPDREAVLGRRHVRRPRGDRSRTRPARGR